MTAVVTIAAAPTPISTHTIGEAPFFSSLASGAAGSGADSAAVYFATVN